MQKQFFLILLFLVSVNGFTQKRYFTKSGNVTFSAGTSLEDIEAVTNTSSSVFDASTGQIEFAVLIKGFEFKRALMQEHFNENYMESDRFPRSVFKGRITNINEVNFQQNGTYPVTVSGSLEIHGVTKQIETKGTMKVAGEIILADADFIITVSDYNIAIPGLVKDKISKTATIKVNCNYKLFK
jgi:hypothetical protein